METPVCKQESIPYYQYHTWYIGVGTNKIFKDNFSLKVKIKDNLLSNNGFAQKSDYVHDFYRHVFFKDMCVRYSGAADLDPNHFVGSGVWIRPMRFLIFMRQHNKIFTKLSILCALCCLPTVDT